MRVQLPFAGEKRTVRRFALIPVQLTYPARVEVWWEWYVEHQEYVIWPGAYGSTDLGWVVMARTTPELDRYGLPIKTDSPSAGMRT